MNEYHRQAYLSSLNLENYMPRWRLPMAPESAACVLPISVYKHKNVSLNKAENIFGLMSDLANTVPEVDLTETRESFVAISDVLRNLTEKKPAAAAVSSIANSVHIIGTETIPSFSLSIWRPKSGLLIIDSRNSHLALPTERLLANVLFATFDAKIVQGPEDVMRWPFFDNVSVPQTHEHACNALQVWLEVELERRPATHLWLLGETAAKYLLPNYNEFSLHVWQWLKLPEVPTKILVAPSLVELLQSPSNKRSFWHCLAVHSQSV